MKPDETDGPAGSARPEAMHTALTALVPEQLWIKEAPLRFFGFEVGRRMTVVRLGDGSLFVHAPMPLDAGTRAELEAVGWPAVFLCPN